jgi:hypothetical protein
MRNHLLIPAFIAIACLPACERPQSEATAPTPESAVTEQALFNGKDLQGWGAFLSENVGMEEVWSVRDGLLVCKGEPMGYLHTDTKYTDFKLTVEYRWAPGSEPGNSGVLMRVNGEARALPRSLEVQLKSGNAGDVFGFHGMKLSGDAARFKTVENHELGGNLTGLSRISGSESAPGEWNVVEITLQQGNLTAVMNGTIVNQATDCEIIEGPIALQSEGGEIHFRKVSITPL